MPFKRYDNGMYLNSEFFGSGAMLRFDGNKMYLSHNRAIDVMFEKI